MDNKSEPKTFGLTKQESGILNYVKQHQDAIFAGLLSNVASGRLGYHVTPNTQMQLSGDFTTITFIELEPVEPEVKTSPVVTAPEQSEAEHEHPADPNPQVDNGPARDGQEEPQPSQADTNGQQVETAQPEPQAPAEAS